MCLSASSNSNNSNETQYICNKIKLLCVDELLLILFKLMGTYYIIYTYYLKYYYAL